MSQHAPRPRLGFLGAGPDELELLLELRAGNAVDLLGVYDADPGAPGLAVAEVAGIPAGSDARALDLLRDADAIVLPRDRRALQDAVRWASGLHAELLSLSETRRRWGDPTHAPAVVPRGDTDATSADALDHAIDTSARLQDRRELAEWLLDVALRVAGANGGSIQLLAAETGELFLVAGRGLSERLVKLGRHRMGDGVSGLVASTHMSQLLHGPKPGRLARERGDIAAAMSLPLEDAGELIGVLNVSSTRPGQRFGEETLRRLERLAPRMARLLRDATRLELATPGLDLPGLLRRFESAHKDTRERLLGLCEATRAALGADAAMLYLATEDGDWLPVVPEAQSATAPAGPESAATSSLQADLRAESTRLGPVRRAALDTALLEPRWVHSSESFGSVPADPLSAAVDRALTTEANARSQVYAPLLGVEPLGVVVLEFTALEAADRAVRDGAVCVEQLALGADALLRAHRQRQRLERYAALAHVVHRLHERVGADDFDAALAAAANRLVGARRAFVRRVDEEQRTFSRPATAGVEAAQLRNWRNLDSRITERTLQTRRALLTTAADDSAEAAADAAPQCSLISVPFVHAGQIVAVLNVYEKEPLDFLERHAFTSFDRDLLENLALVMAWSFANGRDIVAAPPPQPQMRVESVAPAEATSHADGVVSPPVERRQSPGPGPPPSAAPDAREREPADDAGAPDTPRRAAAAHDVAPQHELHELLQEAAEEQRGLGVWLLRFDGLSRLGTGEDSARRTLAATVQRGLRGGDRVAWIAEQDLAVFGFEPPPASVGFEARLAALVRPQLARLGRQYDTGIELRVGASAFPADGNDPIRLLAAAAERAR